MAQQISAFLISLIQANPPGRAVDIQRLLDGDLEYGAHKYAKGGEYHGDQGDCWRVWREIQRARGLSLPEALDELSSQQLRWFAKWAFRNDESAEAMMTYRRYLDDPGKIGPFAHENCLYLDHLFRQGRYHEVLATVDELVGKEDDAPAEQMRAVLALFCLGQSPEAMLHLAAIRDRHHDDGEVWALTAMLAAQLGEDAQAQVALTECLKLGVHDKEREHELLHAMGLSASEWQERRAPFLPDPLDYTERQRQWWAAPGARLLPAIGSTPHWYGGDELQMPACRGCGHQIRQWFVIDIQEIPPLRERLPAWSKFPLLGCTDCSVWMGRHDYEVDAVAMVVRLVNVAISLTRFGEALGSIPEIPKQHVRLEWVPPRPDASDEDLDQAGDWDRPQVAGMPAWAQQPQRVFCKTCRDEMVFVAAMASTTDFEPYVPINNESGYQYHFACDACHTVSVIAQWT